MYECCFFYIINEQRNIHYLPFAMASSRNSFLDFLVGVVVSPPSAAESSAFLLRGGMAGYQCVAAADIIQTGYGSSSLELEAVTVIFLDLSEESEVPGWTCYGQ